jgi:hypothetical protein
MNGNRLNFKEISQSMEVLDRDSQRGVKGGLTAAELLEDILRNGIGSHAGKSYAFGGGQNGFSYVSNTYYGGELPEVVVTATPTGNSGGGSSSTFWSSFSSGSTWSNAGSFGSESYYGGGGGSILYNGIYAETAKDFQAWIDSALNYLDNVYTAASMTVDWALGIGPDNRIFLNDDVAKAFMDSHSVNLAREFYYNKFSVNENLANTSVTGYKGSFGLLGLWNAGLDPIEQFVGTYRINIYNSDGKTLWFVLTNQTSMNSFLYNLGPSWERSSLEPGGNMKQIYIWSEPVR